MELLYKNCINHNQNKLKDFRLSLKSQSIQSHEREGETIKINKYIFLKH